MSSVPVQPFLVQFDLNGHPRSVAVDAGDTVLDTIHDDMGLTGTKEVCSMGNCGACTVLLDDRAVNSCLVLTAECEGCRVDTVEGLAEGNELHPVQQAFVDCDALQCGFCTPGQIMSLEALRRATADGSLPDSDDITEAITGNLCRCGAYRHILDAASQVFRGNEQS